MQVIFINDEFKINQYLSPKGKVFDAKIVSKKTAGSISNIIENDVKGYQTASMLQSKLLETIDKPEENKRYLKQLKQLAKQEQNKRTPNLGSSKSVRVRVIGYDQNGNTIVEPADIRNKKALIKLGYDIQ